MAPRDGFQNWGQPVGTDVKEQLVRGLLDAGIPTVEATSFVSPKWVPQMADAAELMARLGPGLQHRVRVLVPNLRGFESAREAGARTVVVNAGVTDGFNQRNLNRPVADTLRGIGEVCRAADAAGVKVIGSVSVAWGCPFDGPVSAERALDLSRRLLELGCRQLSIADTIGVAEPRGVRALAGAAVTEFGADRVAVHFHDTRGMGLANSLAALEVGVREFEGSLAGIGGCPFAPRSTGNVCSEDVLHMFQLMGEPSGANLAALIELAGWLSEALSAELPGRLHRAGLAPWAVPA